MFTFPEIPQFESAIVLNLSADEALTGGAWKTIDGSHVYIKDGAVVAGAEGKLNGKKEHEVHEHFAKKHETSAKRSNALADAARKSGDAAAHAKHLAKSDEHLKAAGRLRSDAEESKRGSGSDHLTSGEHEEKANEHYEKSDKALAKGDIEGHAKHRDLGNHHSDEADRLRNQEKQKVANSPKAAAKNPSSANSTNPLTHDAILHEFNDLHANAGPQGAPIHELRERIRQKFGDQAASHDTFDPMVKSLRGKNLRMVSGGESVEGLRSGERAMTPAQMEASIPGAHDSSTSGPAEVFTHLTPHQSSASHDDRDYVGPLLRSPHDIGTKSSLNSSQISKGGDAARNRIKSIPVKNHGLSAEKHAEMTSAFNSVTEKLPDGMAKEMRRFSGFHAYASDGEMLKEMIGNHRVDLSKKAIRGCAMRDGSSVGMADVSEKAGNQFDQTSAHEIGHVVDAKKNWLGKTTFRSDGEDWKSAAKAEINEGSLSKYATVNPGEGWAEYSRLVIHDPETAEKSFPKCWAVWKSHGLVN